LVRNGGRRARGTSRIKGRGLHERSTYIIYYGKRFVGPYRGADGGGEDEDEAERQVPPKEAAIGHWGLKFRQRVGLAWRLLGHVQRWAEADGWDKE
jgi:hypothetical protein